MNPVLQVDKDEWETFLSEFSKLAKNYELILGKLDLALAQIEVQREKNGQLEDELDEIKQDQSAKNPNEAERTVKTKPGFLEFFSRIGLFRLTRRPQTITYASCRRCGYVIKRASRFCVGCGADFGAFVCPCGRGVSPDDKFCDQCGRTT
jgi:rubrerythrin